MRKATFDSDTKVWSGPKTPPLFNPEQSLGQLILRVLEATPEAVTQISADTGVEITCGEMRERTLKIAAHLTSLGLKKGDVIGFVASNCENLAPAVFACFLLGLPVNPLAPVMVESDIVQMYSKTKPKLIICDADRLKVVQSAVDLMKSDAEIFTFMETIDGYDSVAQIVSKSGGIENFPCPDVDPHSTAMIMSSSGTTDLPKGINRTHHNIIHHCVPVNERVQNVPGTCFQYSPIYWFSGTFFMVFGTLFKYRRVITSRSFDADDMIEVIDKYKVTFTFSPPFVFEKLLKSSNLAPLKSMKLWLVGGSTVPKELCEKFEKFVPNGLICVGYGMTELGMMAVNENGDNFGSTGTPANNTKHKIVDDEGNALENGEQGEVYTVVASRFAGYFAEPQKTAAAFEGEWFKTGDLGYFDSDGCLYLTGRKKELMKFNNYQVTPSELEAIIDEIEGVVSSCVVGVLQKETGNDIIHAFVIVKESSQLTEHFVINYVNSRVFDAKKLRGGVHFVEAFPLGITGKINKIKLRNLAGIRVGK